MDTLPLLLGAVEVICLADAVRNEDCDGDRPIGKALLLKLGSAYLELVGEHDLDSQTRVSVGVTEPETWLLRSKVQTGTVGIDKTVIGAGLLRKLYALLLEFNTPEAALPTVAAPHVNSYADAQRMREEEDARAGESTD